jgi:HSP20 family protein
MALALKNLAPWARKQLPIRRTNEYNVMTPLWSDFDRSFQEMGRMFDQVFGLEELGLMGSQFMPSLDVHENDKEFQISVETPGLDEKDIDISISHDVLTISGEKKEDRKVDSKGTYRLERRYGSFSRSIPLPENCVDRDKAEASYKNGVLTIKLPKTGSYKESVKKIPIQAGQSVNKGDNGASS